MRPLSNRFTDGAQRRRQTWIAVIVAIIFPTLVTWVYFIEFEGRSAVVGGVGKALQFAFPACWVLLWMRTPLRDLGLPRPDHSRRWSTRTGVLVGIGTGLAIVVATVGYYRWAISGDTLAVFVAEIEARVSKLSLDNPLEFVALGAFYSLIHAFLEEYYFRWFVFGRLRHLMKFVPAAIVSALAFMAHHVIVLSVFFGASIHTVFLSLCIAVGGLLWAWHYERSGSLIGPWISHLLVDAGIFLVGYDLVFVVIPGLKSG